jgi:ABC-type antimicrobial peptide transport system permease subunit
VYKPMLDWVNGGVLRMTLVVRTDVAPLSLLPNIRTVVHSLDPNLPITDIKPMDVVVGDSLSRTSFTMTLLALAAAIALFLGAIGIYGVISYGVVQRTGEIGVRQALGAEPSAVRGLTLRDGLVVAGIGIVLGLVTATLMGRFIASLLYGVCPYDVVTLAGGSVVFLLVAALASAIPARRAARIPPVVALRAG